MKASKPAPRDEGAALGLKPSHAEEEIEAAKRRKEKEQVYEARAKLDADAKAKRGAAAAKKAAEKAEEKAEKKAQREADAAQNAAAERSWKETEEADAMRLGVEEAERMLQEEESLLQGEDQEELEQALLKRKDEPDGHFAWYQLATIQKKVGLQYLLPLAEKATGRPLTSKDEKEFVEKRAKEQSLCSRGEMAWETLQREGLQAVAEAKREHHAIAKHRWEKRVEEARAKEENPAQGGDGNFHWYQRLKEIERQNHLAKQQEGALGRRANVTRVLANQEKKMQDALRHAKAEAIERRLGVGGYVSPDEKVKQAREMCRWQKAKEIAAKQRAIPEGERYMRETKGDKRRSKEKRQRVKQGEKQHKEDEKSQKMEEKRKKADEKKQRKDEDEAAKADGGLNVNAIEITPPGQKKAGSGNSAGRFDAHQSSMAMTAATKAVTRPQEETSTSSSDSSSETDTGETSSDSDGEAKPKEKPTGPLDQWGIPRKSAREIWFHMEKERLGLYTEEEIEERAKKKEEHEAYIKQFHAEKKAQEEADAAEQRKLEEEAAVADAAEQRKLEEAERIRLAAEEEAQLQAETDAVEEAEAEAEAVARQAKVDAVASKEEEARSSADEVKVYEAARLALRKKQDRLDQFHADYAPTLEGPVGRRNMLKLVEGRFNCLGRSTMESQAKERALVLGQGKQEAKASKRVALQQAHQAEMEAGANEIQAMDEQKRRKRQMEEEMAQQIEAQRIEKKFQEIDRQRLARIRRAAEAEAKSVELAALEAAEQETADKERAARQAAHREAELRKARWESEQVRHAAWSTVYGSVGVSPHRASRRNGLAEFSSARASYLLVKPAQLEQVARDPNKSILELTKQRVEEGSLEARAQRLHDEMAVITKYLTADKAKAHHADASAAEAVKADAAVAAFDSNPGGSVASTPRDAYAEAKAKLKKK